MYRVPVSGTVCNTPIRSRSADALRLWPVTISSIWVVLDGSTAPATFHSRKSHASCSREVGQQGRPRRRYTLVLGGPHMISGSPVVENGDALRRVVDAFREKYPRPAHGGLWALAGFSLQTGIFLLHFFRNLILARPLPLIETMSDIVCPAD